MKKPLIVGLATLLVVAFASISFASAVTFYPQLTISPNAKTWTIDTSDPSASFSGKDVDVNTIVATYYLIGDSTPHTITPKNIHVSPNKITIQFDSNDLPQIHTVDATHAAGTLNTGDDFYATGPGFAWGRTR